MSNVVYASCDVNGRVHYTATPPQEGSGLILLCSGEAQKVYSVISALGQKARGGSRFYVPNVREGHGGPEAVAAVAAFAQAIQEVFGMPKNDMAAVKQIARRLKLL